MSVHGEELLQRAVHLNQGKETKESGALKFPAEI